MLNMKNHWERVERALAQLGCQTEIGLNSGATQDSIQELERHVGVELPQSLKGVLLQHDGQAARGAGLIFGHQMLSVAEIRSNWDVWRSIDEAAMNEDCADFMSSLPTGVIKPQYTNLKWIPLAHDWSGNHIGLDFDPDGDGTAGQVISFGRDEDQKKLKANSFDEFWRQFAKSLNAAKWNGDYLDWDDT